MHRLADVTWYTHTTAHLTWEQTAGGTVRTARSTRGNTETRAGPNGEIGGFYRRLDPRVGPLHRETACPGGTQGGLNCLTHLPPRCFPTPNLREADGGGGRLTGRRRPLGCRLECFGSPVPLLWTGVPTPSTPVDRQDPLPILRCPGNASCCARVFPDHPDHP